MVALPPLIENIRNSFEPYDSIHSEKMMQILRNVRISLGMDIAFISEFKGQYKKFRYVDHGTADTPIRQGDIVAVSDGFCQKVALGHLPQMIPDTRLQPGADLIPETAAMPIGSHMSVPLRLCDGTIYGTLCCFSFMPDPTLNERELRMLQAIGNLVASEINAHAAATGMKREKTEAILTAIQAGDPSMVYQPIFRLADGSFLAAEALARFSNGPRQAPTDWFATAAECGVSGLLETSAIRNAIRDYATVWTTRPEAVLTVNVSARTIMEADIALSMTGAAPDRLVLEITEHDEIDDYETLAATLAPLRAKGVRIAVDDAGAGYASLHHVISLSPDIIKLDISLTRRIDQDRTRTALAAAFLEFANQTGSIVVAEGIETQAELSVLTQLGVHLGQGYLLGKPGSALTLPLERAT